MTSKDKKKASAPDKDENNFQLLLTLITLLKSARHKDKKSELEFLMVNQTFNLIPYSNCIYWELNRHKIDIKTASGLVQIDNDGPYTQWLARVINDFIIAHQHAPSAEDDKKDEKKQSFSKLIPITSDITIDRNKTDWNKWVPKNAFILLLYNNQNDIFGGLWIDRDDDIQPLKKALLEDLGDGYAHALQNFYHQKNGHKAFGIFSFLNTSGLRTKLFFLFLLLIMLIPVRMSSSAPAEVVASKPASITIPFDGVIDTVEVSPGQDVKKGDVLIKMDSTLLENQVTKTLGELKSAQVSLLKTERESMKDRSKLAEISLLKAQLSQKTAEVNFARKMLSLANIVAEKDGIVIFSDANSLRGKPVQTGEQIMQLAKLDENELLIRMPINAMIEINEDIPARFFLNVMPFNSRYVEYTSIGYQATMDSSGLMSYKIRGDFIDPTHDDIRIGWTGTGKVYGDRTVLGINILRRPITTLRRKLGI